MKNLIIILLSFTTLVRAQSVIISPNNGSSIIEAKATNKAITLPSVSATTAITSPQKGMVVFDDATGSMSYYNGMGWVPLSNSITAAWALNGTNINNTNAGSVGIGTSTPFSTTKLHIVDRASKSGVTPFSSASVAIDRNSGSTYLNFLGNDGFESGILFGRTTGGSRDGGMIYSPNKSLDFRTNDIDRRMILSPAGNLGIGGLEIPLRKLHIHESAASKSNYIHISNAATGVGTGMLVGVDVTGRTGIYDAGAGIDINSGPIGLAFTPSSTPSGNAMEINDKGLFSSQLPDVNIVPLALGQLKFTVDPDIDPVTNLYTISNVDNFYKGQIISSIEHKAKHNPLNDNFYTLKLYLDPTIRAKYSNIIMFKNILAENNKSYIKPHATYIDDPNPSNSHFFVKGTFDPGRIDPDPANFVINFRLYGVRL